MARQDQHVNHPDADRYSSLVELVRSSRPFLLLAALLAQLVVAPLIANHVVQIAMTLTIIAATVYMAVDTRTHLLVSLGLAIPGAALVIIADVTGNRNWDWASYPFLLLLYLQIVRLMLQRIFKAREVTLDIIGLGLCTYVLLGLVWVLFYTPVMALDPDSFVFNTPPDPQSPGGTIVYFSYVTLTTLGYGDIVPVSPLARGLAILEALTGVLFLAVLISQLVGKYSARRR